MEKYKMLTFLAPGLLGKAYPSSLPVVLEPAVAAAF